MAQNNEHEQYRLIGGPTSPSEGPVYPRARVLLVEDNDDDVLLFRRTLRKLPEPVALRVAGDGEEAQNVLFNEISLIPHVVVLDLQLPKINGLNVLRELRKRPETKYVPVIILTSSLLDSDITTAYDYGANSYVRKPLTMHSFTEIMSTLINYWTRFNRIPSTAATERYLFPGEQG